MAKTGSKQVSSPPSNIITIPDPTETLIDAFNQRTRVLEGEVEAFKKEVTEFKETYQQQLGQLKSAFDRSAKNTEKIMVAVIVVLVIGFLTLLFALVAVVMSGWQYGSDALKTNDQSSALTKLQQQQDSIVQTLNIIQHQTKPQ